jgi:hypothetical protein
VSIKEIIKQGEPDSQTTVTVTVPGGFDPKNASIQLHIPGAPKFEMGDRVIFFLVKHHGKYQIQNFALGAYYHSGTEENAYALRSIDDKTKTGQVRDFKLFKNWIHRVVQSTSRRDIAEKLTPKNYYVSPKELSHELNSRYNLFTYEGNNVRWFNFDNGSSVVWQTHGTQTGATVGKMTLMPCY